MVDGEQQLVLVMAGLVPATTRSKPEFSFVMPGFMPGIHVLLAAKTWMAGSSPAMTKNARPYVGHPRLTIEYRTDQPNLD
jgi:hypothetical protein